MTSALVTNHVNNYHINNAETRLFHREKHDEDVVYSDDAIQADNGAVQQLGIFEPVLARETARREEKEKLLDAEVVIGRLAMVAAVLFLSTELIGGKSIPEQIHDYLSWG